MNKIISFSLWGNDPKYCVGAIRNAHLAQKHFPEWECRFYCGRDVPGIYISALNAFNHTRVWIRPKEDFTFGAFWRFDAMEPDTIVLSRDCDSRLSEREKQIVDEWLVSDSKLSVIRDHANHYEFPILAGMWGIKDGLDENMLLGQPKYNMHHAYLMDQLWLRDLVWPKLQHTAMIHGIKETIWMRNSYKSIGKDFIGQTYDANDIPVYDGVLA
jgi:hypothetical protein